MPLPLLREDYKSQHAAQPFPACPRPPGLFHASGTGSLCALTSMRMRRTLRASCPAYWVTEVQRREVESGVNFYFSLAAVWPFKNHLWFKSQENLERGRHS